MTPDADQTQTRTPAPWPIGCPAWRLRRQVGLELGAVVIFTALFLWLFPRRPLGADIAMALAGLGLVGATRRYTRERVWGHWPSAPPGERRRRVLWLLAGTGAVALGFAVIGLIGSCVAGGACFSGCEWGDVVGCGWGAGVACSWGSGAGVVGCGCDLGAGVACSWSALVACEWRASIWRLFRPMFFGALVVFLPWALFQQTLFQFYLLGRLRVLLPMASPIMLSLANGVLFGAAHVPEWDQALLTIPAGVAWSYVYCRDRALGPIALSHALLGVTYFYWVRGSDPVSGLWSKL
jgi:Type II CAAX prenyl endopeptidase Rce1-like